MTLLLEVQDFYLIRKTQSSRVKSWRHQSETQQGGGPGVLWDNWKCRSSFYNYNQRVLLFKDRTSYVPPNLWHNAVFLTPRRTILAARRQTWEFLENGSRLETVHTPSWPPPAKHLKQCCLFQWSCPILLLWSCSPAEVSLKVTLMSKVTNAALYIEQRNGT